MDQDKELAALKALAEAATQGNWRWWACRDGEHDYAQIAAGKEHVAQVRIKSVTESDLRHIAAANPSAILSLISRIEQQAAQIAEYQQAAYQMGELHTDTVRRAQGGNTSDSASLPSPAVDLSGLTRYAERIDHMKTFAIMDANPEGEYVKLTDVQALLAAPARDVGGLTESQREAVREAVQEALARTNAYVCGRTWSAWQVGTMSEDDFQHACTDGYLLDEITAAVCEVLATKAAEPVQAEVRNAALAMLDAAFNKEIERVSSLDYPANSMCRTFYAKLRESFATSPAPSVKQEAMLVPKWAGEFSSHGDWVNRAQRVLSVPSHKPPAVCVDAKGRRCFIGADMARARDEGAFPVRYFWECELAAPSASQGEVSGWQPIETAPHDGRAMLLSQTDAGGAWIGRYEPVYQSGYRPDNPWFSLMLNRDYLPKPLKSSAPTHWMPLPAAPSVTDGEVSK